MAINGFSYDTIVQTNGMPYGSAFSKVPYTPNLYVQQHCPAKQEILNSSEQTTVETVMNMTPKNRAHFESEKEAIHLILTGIGDEVYSTVMHVQTAQEMGNPSKGYNKSHATTRYKGKEIAKPITPPSESASEEDSDPEQAQRDKDM
ncbi:hypothetical protein Tco_0975239 [Tanacetum coccineum]|uniref:Uncharacterized protein n=1 Tax=Tanacetum coccineum TaxID=301880 RepID=A0ABQ5EE50_9ASTR